MKSKVLFFNYSRGGNALCGIEALFAGLGFDKLARDSVAVKLHMGELGNIAYIRPIFVSKVVSLVKKAGGNPFATDTTVIYPGGRETAEEYLATAASNGFVEDSIGAPIVIADENGDAGVSVTIQNPIQDCQLREVKVASGIYRASSLLVLSHVKGHSLSGFGGAIKNLGMGCVTKESKRAQHRANCPLWDESRCDSCGSCAEACPPQAITMSEGKPSRDLTLCTFCSTCRFECPSNAWVWPDGAKEKFQVELAHAAAAVFSRFSGKIGFINFVQDVTPDCDCCAPSGRPLVADVGILASYDPVAIDKASLDLIDKAPLIPGTTSARPPDLLGRMHRTSSLIQLKVAEKLGMGSLGYELSTL
jgi:uncharacterized Fe-S center protein